MISKETGSKVVKIGLFIVTPTVIVIIVLAIIYWRKKKKKKLSEQLAEKDLLPKETPAPEQLQLPEPIKIEDKKDE
jgi:H+/gluconate symporter-like permease